MGERERERGSQGDQDKRNWREEEKNKRKKVEKEGGMEMLTSA